MEYRYHTCDVFTHERFGGNPLAVVPDARGLSSAQMQALAREFNYSETTFVLPAEQGHTRRVRIFTPATEVPFAGHPNIGTAFLLAELGELPLTDGTGTITFEEKAGLVAIRIQRDGHGLVHCELTAPESLSLGAEVDRETLAHAVGLQADEIATQTHNPCVASVGLPFLVAEVTTRDALARATASIDRLRELEARGISSDIHLYTRDADGFDLHTSMFAPLTGVPEDPATGSANCALIALLAHASTEASAELRWNIAQGVDMGRPSMLTGRVQKAGGEITSVHMGGHCVRMFTGEFRI